ncbi:putative ribosomal protein L25/L23 [Medicago truncatula]|uniref:50S ribosomal protein L23 n=1 Tax=Medicago truncatula TaxID=3880 RepID=A0A072TVE0_MEDTR|nr:50S ribosomal protein L23 [Medicago truncatula]RHN42923.1 putative ribosomal protein L25/L23 [Medicago truncatula]
MAEIVNTVFMIPLMPTSFSGDFKQITFKTIPSVSKVEIKHVVESFYQLEVKKVRTLNVKGKPSKNRSLVAKPDYKKAYVTLKNPASFSNNIFAFHSTANAVDDNNKDEKKMVAN